jgi:hypothetical protein
MWHVLRVVCPAVGWTCRWALKLKQCMSHSVGPRIQAAGVKAKQCRVLRGWRPWYVLCL